MRTSVKKTFMHDIIPGQSRMQTFPSKNVHPIQRLLTMHLCFRCLHWWSNSWTEQNGNIGVPRWMWTKYLQWTTHWTDIPTWIFSNKQATARMETGPWMMFSFRLEIVNYCTVPEKIDPKLVVMAGLLKAKTINIVRAGTKGKSGSVRLYNLGPVVTWFSFLLVSQNLPFYKFIHFWRKGVIWICHAYMLDARTLHAIDSLWRKDKTFCRNPRQCR